MNNKYILWVIIISQTFLLGIFAYFLLGNKISGKELTEVREKGNYTFINPLLECNTNVKFYNPFYIEQEVSSYVSFEKNIGNVQSVSFYARLLNNGATFGYNQDEKYVPASLIKIPLIFAFFKNITLGQLQDEIQIENDGYKEQERNFGGDRIQLGQKYSLDTLVFEMLTNSDNLAANILIGYLGFDKIYQVYEQLGLGKINFEVQDSINISAKNFAAFFRILYNASFLDRESSEYVLKILSHSTFKAGIAGGLPDSVVVANKFGERSFDETWEKQLHDCGIVYLEENPYVICIMTKGNNFDKQLQVIQKISRMVYDDIKKSKK